jgi:serine/threonine protein kinase
MEETQITQSQSNDLSKSFPPLNQSKIKDSLEKLLNKIPKQKQGTLENIFHDKSKSLKSTVKELLEEIELRKNLDYNILKKIDNTICKENTVIMNLENQENIYAPERDLEIKKFEKEFKDGVLDLEKEKRKEYLECWRDMVNIKKYLLIAFKEYWDFARSRNLLSKHEN